MAVWFALTVPCPSYERLLSANTNEKANNQVGVHQSLKSDEPVILPAHDDETVVKSTSAGEDISNNAPRSQSDDAPIASILTLTLEKLNVNDVVWSKSSSDLYYQVTFPSGKNDCEEILQELRIIGIGSKWNTKLNVLPCTLQYNSQDNASENKIDCLADGLSEPETDGEKGAERELLSKTPVNTFLQSIKSRLTVAQVVEGVRGSALLTFDFIMFVLLAGMLAALGLVENSSVILVAAMLVSPMMGPILAGTFGFVIQDRNLQLLGVKSELVGLALCLSFGFVFGIIYGSVEHWSDGFWLTEEMVARGRLRSLWVGVLIALPSGAGVALSVLGGNAGSLVGVAISASLLPPVVNAGLLWAVALTKYIGFCLFEDGEHFLTPPSDFETHYSDNLAIEALILGIVSLTLTLVNIFCIVLMGVIVLKIKEVTPDKGMPDTKRFWGQDIKEMREYNKTVNSKDAKNFLARIKEDFDAQMQGESVENNEQWRYILDEIASDPVYQTVRMKSIYHAAEPTQTTWHHSNQARYERRTQSAFAGDRSLERSLSTPRDQPSDKSSVRFSYNDEGVVFRDSASVPSSPTRKLTWNFPFSGSERNPGNRGRFVVTRTDESASSSRSSRRSKRNSKDKERNTNLYDLHELVP